MSDVKRTETSYRVGDLVQVISYGHGVTQGCVGYVVGYEDQVRRLIQPGSFSRSPGYKVAVGNEIYDFLSGEIKRFQ